MFKIIEGDFKNNKYSDEEYLDNWPMLYILENGRQAYIGESSHVKTRMTQHSSIEEKRIFDKVHFIYSKLFNQSVTFDYESKLIQYIAADELYEVTNKNKGIADKQYYQKQEYDEKFATLWRKLQREKLAKHSIEEIENSDLFKYSPYKELNDSQRQAVEDIVQKLKEGTVDKVVVNGMPGSGKTIVAVYLMKYLADSEEYAGKQIGFVVPQTSLRKTMKIIFRSIYGLSPSQVLSPSDVTKKKYDILLVDEAHRLHQYKNISYMGTFKANCEKLGLTTEADELDWILMQSKQAVLFYDSMQVVGPSGIDFERFDKKMEDSFNRRMIAYFTLITQMRVQGGNAYIDQVKDTNLKNKLGRIPALRDFDDYGEMDVIRIFDNNSLGSYYKFLVRYEKEYKIRLSEDEEKVIEFVSKKLASGKRVQELQMLKRLLAYARGFSKLG